MCKVKIGIRHPHRKDKFMKLIAWNIFPEEIEAYTVTKDFGDMSFNNPDKNLIFKNRKNLANYLHTTLENMVAPNQVHSKHFQEVSKQDGGKGIFHKEDAIKETDALYTRDSDLFLISFHADCTPVLLYCRDQGIVAAIHSGWLGTTKQIVSTVVKHLIKNEHCNPKEIFSYIGPCINQENFEVQQDVIDLVQTMDFDTTPFIKIKDATHYLLDNKGLNKQQLLNLGIPENNITVSPYCTITNNDLFYSHRKKETGRSITIINKRNTGK